jgi:hypothetical protein
VLDDVASQVVADRVGIPAGMPQEPLKVVRRGIADGLGKLPRVLALDAIERAAEVSLSALLEILA